MTAEPNRIVAEPMPDYLASEAVGGGSLHTLLGRSPRHYRQRMKYPPTSSALTLGTLAHLAILEPDEWWSGYVRKPEGDARFKEVKAAIAQVEEANPHATLVKSEDFDAVVDMARSVEESGAMPIGIVERSVYWTGHGGLALKCRPDDMHEYTHYSLKTTRDASRRPFLRDALKLGYVHSLGHYHNGLLAATEVVHKHVVIAVETKPPYAVAVYDVPRYVIAWGAAEMDAAVRLMLACDEAGIWPGYPRGSLDFEWMKSQVEGVPS